LDRVLRAASLHLPEWTRRSLSQPQTLANRLRRSVLALPLATVAALTVVVINELSFERSMQALTRLEQRSLATVRIEAVLRRLLDAETAVRGYLLTGRRLYLAPYELAASDVAEGQRWLRQHSGDDAIALGLLQRLSVQADAALADMETTLRAFDAGERRLLQWQDRLGRQPMERVRSLSAQLLQREHEHIARQRQAVFDTLQFSRIGVDLMAALSVLALLVVLRQTAALDAAQRRHTLALREQSGRLEDEVQRRSDDLTELAKHLQTVREDESNRLAHVLHEELGALLTTAKLDLARLRGQLSSAPPEVHQRLAQLSASIDSGITLKRRIIDGLRPLSLSNLGLVSALQLQLRQLGERTGLKVHGELQSLPLSETSQITIYRLVQEALTNIAKYAHATQVTVQLGLRGDRAWVSVEDDGQGFDAGAPCPGSHGLRGMRYRVEAVGGRLHVRSAPGRGTRIQADLPLQTAPDAAAESA
jgi:signal transduction histidine kinase